MVSGFGRPRLSHSMVPSSWALHHAPLGPMWLRLNLPNVHVLEPCRRQFLESTCRISHLVRPPLACPHGPHGILLSIYNFCRQLGTWFDNQTHPWFCIGRQVSRTLDCSLVGL